jgi:hypothetical protein
LQKWRDARMRANKRANHASHPLWPVWQLSAETNGLWPESPCAKEPKQAVGANQRSQERIRSPWTTQTSHLRRALCLQSGIDVSIDSMVRRLIGRAPPTTSRLSPGGIRVRASGPGLLEPSAPV